MAAFERDDETNMKKATILLCTMGITIITFCICWGLTRKERNDKVNEISPVLEYVRNVMKGDVSMEEGMEALEVYRDIASNVENAKITFEIDKIKLNKNDRGYIVVEYQISDWGDGRAKWTMEKESDKWKVTDVYDRPDGYIPE